MNKRKPGSTKPTREEVAQFAALSIFELGRLLAAGKEAMRRKLATQRNGREPDERPLTRNTH